MEFSTLNTNHPSFDRESEERAEHLYKGGDILMAHAKDFIPRLPGEPVKVYESRLSCASYTPYFWNVINTFSSQLFSKDLSLVPAADASDPDTMGGQPKDEFYRVFANNCDKRGTTFNTMLRRSFDSALQFGRAYIGYDFPRPDINVETLEQEKNLVTDRCYLYDIPVEQLLDYERDEEDGEFDWVVIRCDYERRSNPGEARDTNTICFKVWTRVFDSETNEPRVRWDRYELKLKKGRQPGAKQDIPKVDGGDTSFTVIPIVEFKLDDSLCVGSKIATLCGDHFRMRTALNYAQNKSLFAAPVYKQGSSIEGVIGSPEDDPQRGNSIKQSFQDRGVLVIGEKDDLFFAEPEGKAYHVVNEQLKEQVDSLYQVVNQMAHSIANTTKALGRSGTSKHFDRDALAILLTAMGGAVRDFAKRIYNAISKARKDNVAWEAKGLTNYEAIDREQLLKEALAAAEYPIPSPTFHKDNLLRLAVASIPDLSPAIQLQIKKEIDDAVDSGKWEPLPINPDEESDANSNSAETEGDDIAEVEEQNEADDSRASVSPMSKTV